MRSRVAVTIAFALVVSLPAMASGPPAPQADRDILVGPALHVADLGRSLHFYKDVLGMTVTMQFGGDGQPLDVRDREAKGQLGKGFANTTLSFGGGPDDPLLMLLPVREAAPPKIEHGYGYSRTAFRMANLPAINARLKAAGFEPGEIRGAHGVFRIMMIKDPDGYTVEIVERSPRK